MGKTLCITELVDSHYDPKDATLLRSFLQNTLAASIANWIEKEGKRVLVVCHQGQNRSAAVCILTHQCINGGFFHQSSSCLRTAALTARSQGQNVPTQFLSSGGGSYFSMLFGDVQSRRQHASSAKNDGGSSYFDPHMPYRLQFYKHNQPAAGGSCGGSLWIGNFSGFQQARNDHVHDFDILINLSGKKPETADHCLRWKDCQQKKSLLDLFADQMAVAGSVKRKRRQAELPEPKRRINSSRSDLGETSNGDPESQQVLDANLFGVLPGLLWESNIMPYHEHIYTSRTQLMRGVDFYVKDPTQFNYPIGLWDVSQITDFSFVFDARIRNKEFKNFNESLSGWDVSNATNLQCMFWGCSSFNGNVSTWNVSSVTNLCGMFRGCKNFNGNVSSWDVAKATTLRRMFDECEKFNGDVSSWDVSNATNVSNMFAGCTSFNGDVSSWNLANAVEHSGTEGFKLVKDYVRQGVRCSSRLKNS